jgi:hypothetical protein
LPESAQVKAKYTAKDAYYVTPRPAHNPPPPSETSSVTSTKTEAEPCESEGKGTRFAARLVLLGLSVIVMFPLVFWFSSRFYYGEDLAYSILIGNGLLLLLVWNIMSRLNSEEGRLLSKEFFVVPLVLALLIVYVITVIWSDVFIEARGLFTAVILLVELISMGITIHRKKILFTFFWICLIAVTLMLLVRIIVA